jgi:ATP-dependent RNA helicase SUPV3L1/SUV3
MLGDPARGYAFTKAVLGLGAKQIHLCGDASANGLIGEITELTEDKLELNQYERLSGELLFENPMISFNEIKKYGSFELEHIH